MMRAGLLPSPRTKEAPVVTITPPPLSDVQPTMLPLSSSADVLLLRTMPPPLEK